MSSLRLDPIHESEPSADPWVEVRSPRFETPPEATPETLGVVLSLRARREAIARGHRPSVTVEVAEGEDEDEALSRDLADDMDARWDS